MRTNHVKEKLQRGEPALGAWLSLPNVPAARIMARLGFDWLCVDMEHSAHNAVLMADMVATIADAGTECAPIVRIPGHGVEWFKWALDAGAWGVVVPMVNTREEALRAVDNAKYPPRGTRSIGGAFGPYGFGITNWPEYARAANDETLLIVQVESKAGLDNVEEILSVPGIDVAFVGPNDLHAHLGLTPSSDGAEPEFMEALERIKQTAQQHHVPLGIFSSDGNAAVKRIRQGFQFISVTTDISSMIADATRNLRLVRDM
ncbi:MAG TPA: aldolase/citrate lyase family protein [Ktedonobacteraceae bacterium]|jgi:4-hydroxy-2-oxoheptanedioate aldolase|nr:aldolase/citrate lyase family protein [Ktedonobacteraceae bacterium]